MLDLQQNRTDDVLEEPQSKIIAYPWHIDLKSAS